MRPEYGTRKVTCHECTTRIEPQTPRLSDVVFVGSHNGKRLYRRLYYHPLCFTAFVNKWWEENKYVVKPRGKGRPKSSLSEEGKRIRKNLLARLSQYESFYQKVNPLDWTKIQQGDRVLYIC